MQSADPTPGSAVAIACVRHASALALCIAAVTGLYAINVVAGLRETARNDGVVVTSGLRDSVRIVRDARNVPHIVAGTDRDLYFAEGYAQGSDRLFQLDVTRRYAYGRLAEVLGARVLALDKIQRAVDIDGVASRQLAALSPQDREAIAAFSAGVNAAAASQPLPVEFRMLLYRPEPWTPKDSLAVSIVASLALADSPQAIFERHATWRHRGARCFDSIFPLSDSRYDVTIGGNVAASPDHKPARDCGEAAIARGSGRHGIGSNAWAAGADRTSSGRALIANDPHLDLTIPGIWYLIDIRSPHVHAAGATIPGIPGVVLGHNENLAWASTNAEMATTSVFETGRLRRGSWRIERFHVRFARDVALAYYRTPREFSVPNDNDSAAIALVRWPVYSQKESTIATMFALDRARSVEDALGILSRYRGSPQNFILADRKGAVAYHVAGIVPNDPAWGRYVHPARDLRKNFAEIPFARLPALGPSRNAVVLSANNKPYPSGYPYRLSAQFEPPYRAYRIAQLLRARSRYEPGYFAEMQLDTRSPIDEEIAADLERVSRTRSSQRLDAAVIEGLGRWNGRFDPDSRAATLEHAIRVALFGEASPLGPRLAELRAHVHGPAELTQDLSASLAFLPDDNRAWRDAGATRIEHPLAPMNFGFLNGPWLPGSGDEYTIHLQEPGFAQGFRAVWEVGNWDRGGIAIPSGESGEPGSPHYTDLAGDWINGALRPLPFSDSAVRKSASQVLILQPRFSHV
jgi:penicillin G amidase